MQLPTEYNVIIGKRGREKGGRIEGGEEEEGRKGRIEGERRKECGENGEVREALWSICRKGEGREEERNGGKGREVGSPALWSIMEDVVCQEH